jgi:hypothetical protein
MRGCLPNKASHGNKSGVARADFHFHVLTFLSAPGITTHDTRAIIQTLRLHSLHSLHQYEYYHHPSKPATTATMSSPAAQMGGSKGGKEPILFRFCSEWCVA